MTMKRGQYEYLEDIATSDVAFRATGKTIAEMLMAAADATLEVMLTEPSSLQPRVTREITVSAANEEMLLFNLLEELIYLKDAEQVLLRVDAIDVQRKPPGGYQAVALCVGDRIDAEKYTLGVDVKAVTMHLFSVAHTDAGWESQVILDI